MQNISFCLYISLKIDPLSCFLNFAGFYICLQSVGEKAREIKKVAIYTWVMDQKPPNKKPPVKSTVAPGHMLPNKNHPIKMPPGQKAHSQMPPGQKASGTKCTQS
jgi:hypothetical protein